MLYFCLRMKMRSLGIVKDSLRNSFMKPLERIMESQRLDTERNLTRVFTGKRLSISIMASTEFTLSFVRFVLCVAMAERRRKTIHCLGSST